METNAVLHALVTGVRARGGKLHLLGLLSDGGVHAMNTHLYALIAMAASHDVPVVVHAFTDGRDVQPGTAPTYIRALEEKLVEGGKTRGAIATVHGRYWAMDRDNRWDRVEKAYRAIVEAKSERPVQPNALAGIEASYAAGKTDEFVEPFVVGSYAGVRPEDAALHINFARTARGSSRMRWRYRISPASRVQMIKRRSGTRKVAPSGTFA